MNARSGDVMSDNSNAGRKFCEPSRSFLIMYNMPPVVARLIDNVITRMMYTADILTFDKNFNFRPSRNCFIDSPFKPILIS